MPDLDKNIRAAIADLITSATTDAKVYPWNVLTHDLSEWPGLFRGTERVHGWVVKRSSMPSERKNASRDRRTFVYDIWGYYGFRSGKTGDNSDDEFAEICDDVYDAVKAEPRLGFESDVEYHELLQVVNLTTIDCGEETLHFCQARLTVHLCC